jgi:hypothetical protein
MRLLFNPITITADGRTIGNDLNGALVFLDAAKRGHFTSDDIAVAVKGNNVRSVGNTLKNYGDCADSLEFAEDDHKDHLINSYIGRDHRQHYLDEVLHDTQEPAFTTNIMRFLNASLERITQSDPIDINQRSLAFKDPWDLMGYDKAKDKVFQERFGEVLEECPSYCRTLMKANPLLTIICTTGLLGGIAAFGAIGGATTNQIRLNYNEFATGPKHGAATLLKEEILHYLDDSIQASNSSEYQRAAAELMSNDDKLQAIERLFRTISPKKMLIREYPAEHRNAELFVTYFLIRDHLCSLHKAPPANWTTRQEKTGDEPVPAAVNEQMVILFGQALHKLCVKAEETFKHHAGTVPSPPSGASSLIN